MAYTTTTTIGVRVTTAYGATDWVACHNYNMTRMNDTLLKLSGMPEVNAAGISAGQVLAYSVAAGKFVPYNPPSGHLVIMTTTSTSTTTTSTAP